MRSLAHRVVGPSEATLVILTAAAIRDVRAVYAGKDVHGVPRWSDQFVAPPGSMMVIPRLYVRANEVSLEVSWTGPSGPQSVRRVIEWSEPPYDCVYALHIDTAGLAVTDARNTRAMPFEVSCDRRAY